MNYLLLLLLLIGTLTSTLGRPLEMEESDDRDLEEAEYENGGGVAVDETLGNDEESRQNSPELTHQKDDAAKNQDFTDLNQGFYLQHSAADEKSDVRFSDFKNTKNKDTQNEELYDTNDEIQSPSKSRQSSVITESTDPDANNYKPSRKQNNDLSDNQEDQSIIEPRISNEEGNLLFSDNREQISKIAKNEFNNNEASDSSEQSQYLKQYYNTMQTDNRQMKSDKNHESTHLNLNRYGREVIQSKNIESVNLSNSQNTGETQEKSASEDEELAIKRHIKKLSGEELEDLLNSLSEEKRALLKRIIDNDVDSIDDGSDNISKREITKKALQENNFIENGLSDSNIIQEGSSSFSFNTESSIALNSETTEILKLDQSESNDITSAKSAESNNSENTEYNSSINESNKLKTENSFSSYADDKKSAKLVSDKVTIKYDNKRETNLDDFMETNMSIGDTKKIESDFDTNDLQEASDQGCFCSRDEDMSQLMDEEVQIHGDADKIYKRQAVKADLPDSIRGNLEDSFPNSDAYDETGPYSYSGPLIRVKRTNTGQIMKKRAAALLPNAKVAYVPYRAENDDEDNDEGNEFDDDAFYDRTSHFANGNNNAMEEDSSSNKLEPNSRNSQNDLNLKENVGNYGKLLKNYKMESDTMSLGSDTDSVLSGVEGVDDNLMYSSAVRKRRTADDSSIQMEGVKPLPPSLSTSLANDDLMKF